jgi:hypothetical protein
MVTPQRDSDLKFKQLKWIKPDLSEEPAIMERLFDARFSRRPEIIKMDFWNTSLLLINDFLYTADLLLHRRKNNMSGVYSSPYNAVLYWDPNPRVIHHELMHGLVRQLNPTIELSYSADEYSEKNIAQACFEEGLACWGAVEMSAYKKGITFRHLTDDAHQAHFYERAYRATGPITTDDSHTYIEKCFEKLRPGYFGQAAYAVGHYFVFHCMNHLTSVNDGNLTRGESLRILCNNPPGELLVLRNPLEYSQHLLVSYFIRDHYNRYSQQQYF